MKDIGFEGNLRPARSPQPLSGRVTETMADVEDRLRRFYDSAPEGVLHASFESGSILDVNSSLLRTLGYSRAELLGKPLWSIHPLREWKRVEALFEEAKKTGKAFAMVAQKPRKGVSLRVEMTLQVLDYRAGKVVQETVRRASEDARGCGKGFRWRKRARVLIIDGRKGLVRNCRTLLKGLGHSVEVVGTREEALRKSKASFFDVAFINGQLLDGGGVDVLGELGDGVPRMRRVVVSESPTVKGVIAALNGGADAYLTMPVEESLLGRVMEEQLKAQAEERAVSDERVAEYIETRIRQLA